MPQRRNDMRPTTPDGLNMRLWLMIAVIGAILALIGWYRYLG
jgi:hypothetical protein